MKMITVTGHISGVPLEIGYYLMGRTDDVNLDPTDEMAQMSVELILVSVTIDPSENSVVLWANERIYQLVETLDPEVFFLGPLRAGDIETLYSKV
jgi:hypothetical protein